MEEELEKHDFDKEEDMSKQINLFWTIILAVLSIGLVIFHLYTAITGIVVLQNSIHFLLALSIAYIIYPMFKKKKAPGTFGLPVYDIIFLLLALFVNFYYIIHSERIIYELAYLRPTDWDVIVGFTALVLVFEAARRAIGIVFPVVGIIAVIYMLFGPYFPGIFQHQGFSLEKVIAEMYIGQNGIFQGTLLGVSAKTVAIFILFGALLLVTGGGNMFIKLAMAIAGRLTGGPAKVSTIASGMFGAISGSTAANAATTGIFTIPLMKRNGNKSVFAGGVEAAASCGGQILPPIMGAAAFVLAEVTQISYVIVAAAAIIPAIMFYLGLWASVHFEAKKLNLKPIDAKDMPRLKDVLFKGEALTLFVPMFVLILLLVIGYTPTFSAYWAIISAAVLFIIQSFLQNQWKDAISKLKEASVQGAKTVTLIAVILAVAQVIATVIGMTGIGSKLSSIIAQIGETSLLLTLVLGMIVTIVLGMGVPTIAAYMLAASVIAPAFNSLELSLLSTHMFILYFAILSGITPPVSLAAFITAGIAKAHWLKTALSACKVGFAGFLIPFMFIYNPAFLGQGSLLEVVGAILIGLVGISALAAAFIGYFITKTGWVQRLILTASALLLITGGTVTNIIGFTLFAVIVLFQWNNKNKINKQLRSEIA